MNRTQLKPCQCKAGLVVRHVAFESTGLGDCLQCAWIVRGLRQRYPADRIIWSVTPKNLDWVSCLDHGADEVRSIEGRGIRASVTYRPYRAFGIESAQRGRMSRLEYYSAEAGGVQPVRPAVLVPAEPNGKVICFPFAHWSTRSYLLGKWMVLVEALQAAGKEVVVADHEQGRCGMFPCETFCGRSPAEVFALVGGARAVIAGDSGAAHLGGICGVRTIVLAGPSGSSIYRGYQDVRFVTGKLPCTGCWWQGQNYVSACHSHCASLDTIGVDDILPHIE